MKRQQITNNISHINRRSKITHPTNDLCKNMFTFYETQEFCDICVITSDEIRFHSHKVVLSSSSDYLKAMFGAGHSEITIHEVKSDIFEIILPFMYTGIIELCKETVDDILKAATFLQIKPLIIECCQYKKIDLDVKNCLDIAVFADQLGCIELCGNASKFASAHFDEVFNEKDFLKLNENVLALIISSEDLCVSIEDKVVLSLIKWIDYDKPNREKCAFNLYSRVRYWLLRVEFIKQHRTMICNQKECIEVVFTWLEYHASPDSRAVKSTESCNTSLKTTHKLFIINQYTKETFNPELNTWTRDGSIDSQRSFMEIVNVNNQLLVFEFSNRSQDRFMCLDIKTNKSIKFPIDTLGNCSSYKFALLKNELYAFTEKYSNTYCYQQINKFNSSLQKWEFIPPTNTILSNLFITVVDEVLYAIHNKGICMESFKPDLKKWILKPSPAHHESINSEFTIFGTTGINKKLYIIGRQCIESIQLDSITSVHSFDPILNKWAFEGSFVTGLRNFKLTSWNNRLIICGQNTGYNMFVQEFNPETKQWRVWSQQPKADYRRNDLKYAVFSA